ncbi:Metal-dependent hydrolase, endonuclease/exonuclease/phosphatase family [Aliiroseovarius sediminilitoris]|uniref:Metal-dependent hydrolase, endonuclease/exonuclease/phosphatase family n=1 Tax=Aliiroseovarius sediminilitoris TaxID=1173584 RepID=A0A1I0Q5H4_9RHOB|nr:endonuclease/exonuclease/phosphatase family protein [Aliiroseovarius sediminilitoris]SEW22177.1 Metal-dependent hydrolase, endonuclease/exonuclease/phosphatase family [Aliiroseovarius sediminilitoris]
MEPHALDLKLVTYNMRKAIGLDRRRDPHRILDVINHLDADVVVLQEADRRLGPRPTALPHRLLFDETDFVAVPFDHKGVSLGSHGNAILVRKGLTFHSAEQLELPGLEPRGAVSIEIEGQLKLVGTHLGLLRPYRHQQMRQLAKKLAHSPLPTVIMGDFNEWSPKRGFEPLEHRFDVISPGRSFHAARPVAALDRLALSEGVELRDAGVDQSPLAKVASDHLPVWAHVRVKG